MIDHGGADVAVGEADGFECRALHAVRAGDEIRWHYGPHSNARWLAGYGFAVAGNPDDEATIRLGDGDQTVVFPVGARIDARFTRALAHARRLCGDDTRALVALADAAEVGLELLARPVIAAGDDDWRRACEIVRAGERAVLERVGANARAAR